MFITILTMPSLKLGIFQAIASSGKSPSFLSKCSELSGTPRALDDPSGPPQLHLVSKGRQAALFTKDLISLAIAEEDVGEWISECPSLEAMENSQLS